LGAGQDGEDVKLEVGADKEKTKSSPGMSIVAPVKLRRARSLNHARKGSRTAGEMYDLLFTIYECGSARRRVLGAVTYPECPLGTGGKFRIVVGRRALRCLDDTTERSVGGGSHAGVEG
jgi:hypothetical protein